MSIFVYSAYCVCRLIMWKLSDSFSVFYSQSSPGDLAVGEGQRNGSVCMVS